MIPGLHVVEGGQTWTGSVVNWYKNLIGESVSYDELNAEAKRLPAGADGLIVKNIFKAIARLIPILCRAVQSWA